MTNMRTFVRAGTNKISCMRLSNRRTIKNNSIPDRTGRRVVI